MNGPNEFSAGSGTFTIEDVSAGAHAHGFGSTSDGRSFAFRVRGKTLRVEVYRADLAQAVPDDLDVDAVSETDITDVDLSDERSIVAAVRDAIPTARGAEGRQASDTTLLRTLLGRIGNAIDPT